MQKIEYFTDRDGCLCGRWPGKSVYVKGTGSRKTGQMHLGLVIDREKNLFWSRARGYFIFDPDTLTCTAADPKDVPPSASPLRDGPGAPDASSIIDFGDAFFLDQLIRETGYSRVLDSVSAGSRDTLQILVQYCALEGGPAAQANIWCRSSFASYLYPGADLSVQGIRRLLNEAGIPENRTAFLRAHAGFLLESADKDQRILRDSSTLPSIRSGTADAGKRILTAVLKDSRLPLFFMVLPEDVQDSTMLKALSAGLAQAGLIVSLTTEALPAGNLLSGCWTRRNTGRNLNLAARSAALLSGMEHEAQTFSGSLLISFIVSFLETLIRNRLALMDRCFVSVSPKLYRSIPKGAAGFALEEHSGETGRDVVILEQEPLEEICGDSPSSLFLSMRGLKAHVTGAVIRPGPVREDQQSYLKAFGLACPCHVSRLPDRLCPVFMEEPAGTAGMLAFTFPSPVPDSQIAEKRRVMEEKEAERTGTEAATKAESAEEKSRRTAGGHRGRKPGSKNKKTLEREAAIARGELPPPPPKRPYHRRAGTAPQPDSESES